MRSGMILSKLDKQVLRRIVDLFVEHTGIGVNEGTFRYTVKDVARQLAFGGGISTMGSVISSLEKVSAG